MCEAKDVDAEETVERSVDLDYVLVNELGQFGRFQIKYICLIALPMMSAGFFGDYVFTATAIPHRCRIPECGESTKSDVFGPDWITNAIPLTDAGPKFASCERYALAHSGYNGSLLHCPIDLFDHSITQKCDEFVYDGVTSVVYDFDLACKEWLRTLAGTLSSLGTLLVLPLVGYISDHFGRRMALLFSVFNTALIGVFKAFSVNYTMFLALQLLQTTLGAGLASSAYIFSTELVGPKYRVLTSATSSATFSCGEVVLGVVAWLVRPWRSLLMTLYIPVFLLLSYYWILSESVRWLLAKKKYAEARQVLENVAKTNKTNISAKSMNALLNPPTRNFKKMQTDRRNLIQSIFKSKILLRRVCTTPIWWISTTFVYYGLSINSTNLSKTIYLNYILTVAIEIPGFYTAVLTLDRFGRKMTLCTGFFFSAACNLAFVFIPPELTVFRLVVYLAGKFGISLVFTSLYLYTSELYPTEFRHSLLGFSSMVGRIGSICAPLTPLLTDYWLGLPNTVFAILGLMSGLLVLTQPETFGRKLPDTLEEAETIGK
ncbi:solute carrier family 22 member 2-like isoform X1 [Pieris napi]|uniref:solute carrier family 22 member 2-like isoform X1 n=1 Tax=Pieris napi TaxID=78633 RepID=UPI001FBB475A|nr:solute carrier family 22 member 2-like isoform X1 [Pieris napi]